MIKRLKKNCAKESLLFQQESLIENWKESSCHRKIKSVQKHSITKLKFVITIIFGANYDRHQLLLCAVDTEIKHELQMKSDKKVTHEH